MFFLSPRFPLFDQADPEVPQGGGDHASDDVADPNAEPKEPQQPALTLDAIMGALKASLPKLIDDSVAKQVNGLDAKFDKKFKALEPKKDTPKADAATAENPYWAEEKNELLNRLTNLEKAKDEAEQRATETETDTKLSAALSTFQWREGRQQTVFKVLRSEIQKSDDGALTINGVALDRYVKERIPREYDGFLVAREVGGAGASSNKTSNQNVNVLDKIKPGMSKDDMSAVQRLFAESASSLNRR